MKIEFKFPPEVEKITKQEERLNPEDIKDYLARIVEEDLVDKNFEPLNFKKVIVVINGFQKNEERLVYVSSENISEKKPFRTMSISGYLNEYSIYYLIFVEESP